jgi:protease-4
LSTDSCVSLATPVRGCIQAEAKVENLSTSPAASGGPILPMPLTRTCAAQSAPRIALLDVDGLLLNENLDGTRSTGENPVALFQEKLSAVRADPQVVALVVRINSPGGGTTATDLMWQELQRFKADERKPVVACLMDVGTGGAYYVATAADRIVAHPTTITGGIGVVWNSYNLQDLMGTYGIVPQGITAGEKIDMGSTSRQIPPEARRLLQQMADNLHARFKSVVLEARPFVNANDAATFDGRILNARQAYDKRLIDSIGYLEDALDLAGSLAGQRSAVVTMYRRRNDPAYSLYAVNAHLGSPLEPVAQFVPQLPGLQRSKLPLFLYLWQPEATLDRSRP